MGYKNTSIQAAYESLQKTFESLDDKKTIFRDPAIKQLYGQIKTVSAEERSSFGQEVNALKGEMNSWIESAEDAAEELPPIDVTAPFDVNTPQDRQPRLLPAGQGTQHPLTQELKIISDIFLRMGFHIQDSRQLDDDEHMFEALNFPADHPARDDYDTFMTEEGLIPPAHTSTMQQRVLQSYDLPIRVVTPGRTFRNEDLDARHEHTFHQVEGVYVDKSIALVDMLGTIQAFLEEYFGKKLKFKTQPFFFPFVEPGLEYLVSCPFCDQKGCSICSKSGWIEIMGCGMIHPKVLTMGGIDPEAYSGFAWGFGVERLVMIKYGIEDIRHFHSGRLAFMEQF